MADALDDDWWTPAAGEVKSESEPINENGSKTVDSDVKENDDSTKKKKKLKKKKLKRKLEDVANEEVKPEETKKKKKRKKKKPKVEDEEAELTMEGLWKYFEKELEKSLSSIEIEDVKPQHDNWFLEGSDHTNISPYLKSALNNWTDDISNVGTKGSPVLLILTPGGQRSADLLRDTIEFRGKKCKTIKLFAKHLKLKEQKDQLSKGVVHLGVGTPNRITKLIDEGGMSMEELKYVVIDWSWKDSKLRNIWNMPAVKEDFINLFQKHILPRCKTKHLSIGMF